MEIIGKIYILPLLQCTYWLQLKATDCPATLDTLCEGYYSRVGGPTGQVVVYSGRGRFAISFEVSWPHLSWWEGFQKSSQKLKNRVFGIFCTPGQMPNLHNKVPFFLFFPLHGIERDWYKCNWAPWVWYLGNKPNIFMIKMWDTGTLVTVSQSQFLLFDHFMMSQITFNCDKCHTIVSYSIWDVKKGENKYFGVGHCDQCPNVPIPTIPIWSFSEVKK